MEEVPLASETCSESAAAAAAEGLQEVAFQNEAVFWLDDTVPFSSVGAAVGADVAVDDRA